MFINNLQCLISLSPTVVAFLFSLGRKMKIRFAEKSEAEAISRFVSELTAMHIGPTLPVEGLETYSEVWMSSRR